MKIVINNKNEYLGKHITLEEIESDWLRYQMEGFVRHGCFLYKSHGMIAAAEARVAKLVDYDDLVLKKVDEQIIKTDSEHCEALDKYYQKVAIATENEKR